jgi:hypothetical protein
MSGAEMVYLREAAGIGEQRAFEQAGVGENREVHDRVADCNARAWGRAGARAEHPVWQILDGELGAQRHVHERLHQRRHDRRICEGEEEYDYQSSPTE